MQDSRRGARVSAAGETILLEDQDRSRWDWSQIQEGQELLARAALLERTGSYQFQAAIAVAMAEGAERGLELADDIAASGALDRYLYLHSTRAELLRRLDRTDEARNAYHRALELAGNASERKFLRSRLANLGDRAG